MKNTDRSIESVLGNAGQESRIKRLLIAVAMTGAKFTPSHHSDIGNATLDSILRGDFIVTDIDGLVREAASLHALGVRYFHIHLRNPLTREQSCDVKLYRQLGNALRKWNPEVILSYGGSRNGREVLDAIRQKSEWSRLEHAGLSRDDGGADFVTIQAAAELKIVTDLERQRYIHYQESPRCSFELVKGLETYVPGAQVDDLSIGVHSTKGGANYGCASALSQFEVFKHAIAVRGRLGLPQEVEWTQLARSHALTRMAVDHFAPGLGNTGRLNITILFGFSPLLPFPLTYREFREAVNLARSLERGQRFPALHLTVCVGAAVLPMQTRDLNAPLDVGPKSGETVGPLERLIAYACQANSGVDMLRFGLEDTPFLQGPRGEILPATNVDIARFVLTKLSRHGGKAITDPVRLRHFVTTEMRTPAATIARHDPSFLAGRKREPFCIDSHAVTPDTSSEYVRL